MRTTSFLLLLAGLVAALNWPTSAASIDEAASDEKCIEQTAEYIGQVEIDAPTRELIAEARKHYDHPDQAERLRAKTEGCHKIQMHLHLTPVEVPCFGKGRPLEDEDGYKQIHIDLITAQHLEASPAARQVVEAYFVCRATKAAASEMKKFNLLEAIKQLANEDVTSANESEQN